MKAISIKQPWASMTVAGLRTTDIQNRSTNYRGEVLIVASSRRVGRDFGKEITADELCRLRNAQALGAVPYDEEVPLSAAIGIVELTDCTAMGNGNYLWRFANARLFDTPIGGIKGKQGLFEVEIEGPALPSLHVPLPLMSHIEGDTLHVAMSDFEIDRQIDNWPLTLLKCSDGLALYTPTMKRIVFEGPTRQTAKALAYVSTQEETIYEQRAISVAYGLTE